MSARAHAPGSPVGSVTFLYRGVGKERIALHHNPPSALGTNRKQFGKNHSLSRGPGLILNVAQFFQRFWVPLNLSITTTQELFISYFYKNLYIIEDNMIFQKLFFSHFRLLSFPFSLFLSLVLALRASKIPIILILSYSQPVLLGCWVQERRYTIFTQNGNN